MYQIQPFKGIHYNMEKIKDLSLVTAPPYDVINREQQEKYYELDPHNVIRLILGKEMPGDNEDNNKYTRAGRFINQWLEEGILIRETKDCFYLYEQKFSVYGGPVLTRTGLIAAVRLTEFSEGWVLPHEKTLSQPKVDRLNLMRACKTNLSQVFSLFEDEDYAMRNIFQGIKSSPVLFDFIDQEGVGQRLWKIDDDALVASIKQKMSGKKIYIADGHHRYETALTYRKERMSEGTYTGDEDYNYISMVLVAENDPGLVVLPTHRLLFGILPQQISHLMDSLGRYFSIEVFAKPGEALDKSRLADFTGRLAQKGKETTAFGLYVKNNGLVFLVAKDKAQIEGLLGDAHSAAWKDLDVAVLHELLLHQFLGLSEENMAKQTNLKYTRSIEEVVADVDQGHSQLGFILNPTRVEQILSVASAGDTMPQKSTYFYPKLISGLVFHSL